jgi:hypothetical protein
MHIHGWIDTSSPKSGGYVVCPGDWIVTDADGNQKPMAHDKFLAKYTPCAAAQSSQDDWIPHWANGTTTVPTLGAQLCTRDGRGVGNAVIMGGCAGRDGELSWEILTDAGNTLHFSEAELAESFWPPRWVMDPRDAPGLSRRRVPLDACDSRPGGCAAEPLDFSKGRWELSLRHADGALDALVEVFAEKPTEDQIEKRLGIFKPDHAKWILLGGGRRGSESYWYTLTFQQPGERPHDTPT